MMMGFYNERPIKSVGKARPCSGCSVIIQVGESALNCSGVGDDSFWSATYHHECRKAEVALNALHQTSWSDDWMNLGDDMEWDDWPWLIEAFPAVAERMNITTERFNEVQEERERCSKAWAEIDRQRRASRVTPPNPLPEGE